MAVACFLAGQNTDFDDDLFVNDVTIMQEFFQPGNSRLPPRRILLAQMTDPECQERIEQRITTGQSVVVQQGEMYAGQITCQWRLPIRTGELLFWVYPKQYKLLPGCTLSRVMRQNIVPTLTNQLSHKEFVFLGISSHMDAGVVSGLGTMEPVTGVLDKNTLVKTVTGVKHLVAWIIGCEAAHFETLLKRPGAHSTILLFASSKTAPAAEMLEVFGPLHKYRWSEVSRAIYLATYQAIFQPTDTGGPMTLRQWFEVILRICNTVRLHPDLDRVFLPCMVVQPELLWDQPVLSLFGLKAQPNAYHWQRFVDLSKASLEPNYRPFMFDLLQQRQDFTVANKVLPNQS